MSITVEFKDFEEMKDFAKNLLGAQTTEKMPAEPNGVTPASAIVSPAVQSPAASTQMNTVPETKTMAPVLQAPVAQAVQPPTSPAIPVVPAQMIPTTPASYTQDDLARAAMTLMDSGKQGMLLELLKTFGVEALPALPPVQYGAFATALRGLGAQI